MIEVTRRQMLVGAAAAAVAAAVPCAAPVPAAASASAVGTQAPGFYRYRIGSMEISVVSDGVTRFPVNDELVLNVKKDEVKAALSAAFMEADTYVVPFNPIVVNIGSKLIVIDTGLGQAAYKESHGANGQFLTNLAAAGVDAASVDGVIISHYHVDHINGLLKADNSLAFPNAEILVPALEHKYWMDDGEMSRASTPRISGVFKNVRRVMREDVLKRLRTYEWGQEVVPGVIATGTPGHTPGHTSHIVTSGADKVFVQGDMVHTQIFARNPGWHPFVDHDPVQAESTRRKVYDMIAAERMLVQGFHFGFPALTHIEKNATGYRETPVMWNPTI